MTDNATLQQLGRAVIELEAEALSALVPRLNEDFARACRLILDSPGRVVVTGMGKSGHIGGKIAATLASTGTPAFFVHPGEAQHGDLGMIQPQDVVIAISNSGETGEILTILPIIKRMGAKLIALTGNPKSSLATQADAHLDAGVAKEACPLNLAPTSSTTAALALGRCAGRGTAQDPQLHTGGLRTLAPGRQARPAPAALRARRDAQWHAHSAGAGKCQPA